MVALEIGLFMWILKQPSDTGPHDAIIVFGGSSRRIEQAYKLARQGLAPQLIISPADRGLLARYERRYGKPGKAEYSLEPRADTTFMNALHSARLIKKHGLESVLLVTSDYHIPRSLVLLKLTVMGSGCRIGTHKVATRFVDPGDRTASRLNRLKITYNEMAKLWGSLVEGGLYAWAGPNQRVKTRSSGLSQWLRRHLLFDVGSALVEKHEGGFSSYD
jgi:hypothetical protein